MIEEFAREIYSDLGPGYSERVYHNAMEVLLRAKGIPYESERVVLIKFKDHVIGNLRIDMIIDNTTILEFKIIKSLNEAAECQARNYLHLTGLKTAYLINYPPCRGRGVEIRKIEVEPLGGGPGLDSDRTVEILDIELLDPKERPEEVPGSCGEDSELLLDNAAPLGSLH